MGAHDYFFLSLEEGGCASRKWCEASLKAQTGRPFNIDHPCAPFLMLAGQASTSFLGGDEGRRPHSN